MYEYRAKIENIVDGDTFDLNIDLGFDIWYKIRVRLLDIDTPETRNIKGLTEKEYGKIVKEYATKHFLGKTCKIQSFKSDTDSFGRYLVYCYVEGKNLVDLYNELGINKLHESYSEENVRKLDI